MKIVQLSEEARPFQFSYCNRSNSNNNGYSSDESSYSSSNSSSQEDGLEWKEDDTCVQLCISMPGVKAQDIRLAMKDNHTLRVWGRRASTTESRSKNKRQRLNVREFPIDTQVLDIERAIASIWKDTLVLYAPKKRTTTTTTFSRTSLLEELLESTARSKVVSQC